MKKSTVGLILGSVLFFSLNASAETICEGATLDEGYGFYQTQIKYSEQDHSLSDIRAAVHFINAEGYTDQLLNLISPQTPKDYNYQPRKPEYAGMKRFILARGWTSYILVTPEIESQTHFRAYLQQTGHDYAETIPLVCYKN